MKKVLIVEDDPMLSEIYQKKFEKNGQFEVIHAASGMEAQEKAKKEKPDLVLLDLVLPEMDGFDVLKALREDATLDNTKIIPFSNLSQEDNKKKLVELGADGFISKSEHTPQQLVVEVLKILDQNESRKVVNKVVEVKPKSEKFSNQDKKRILMIEDEEVFLDVFGKKLEEEGFEVSGSLNGKEGVSLLAKQNFALVFIDITLPDMEAKKIITDFKKQFPKSKTKFVVLRSESDLEKSVSELEKIGIEGILDKNKMDPESFVAGVRKIL